MNKVHNRAKRRTGTSLSIKDFSGFLKREHRSYGLSEEKKTVAALYMIVAGDDQTPCRWNGRQLTIEWIDDNGVPLFTKEEATYVINYTYKFFESVGRTAHPILRAVPVFQIQTI